VASAETADDLPLVTVERIDGRLDIRTTPVDSPDQAAAVAEAAAADGDLVGVEVDTPVTAIDHVDSNDTRRQEQWALEKVWFEHAWPTSTGTGEVVAVVDTGVLAGHEDLAGQILAGRYFLSSSDGTHFSGPGATDDNGHGTHVAGIGAANANNATGITGAAPGVDILPVKVLCADGAGVSSDVAEGINWAVDNLSLGGSYTQSVDLAVQYARSNGVVVVAAAGNGKPNPSYPAALPQVIAVGATDSSDAIANFSNRGAYVDLAAPGVGILSTWVNGGYAAKNGTSMASPHVAAAVALVLAARPQWDTDPVAVCTQLIRTALDLGASGRDDAFGHGRIRPDLAVGQPDNDSNKPTCT